MPSNMSQFRLLIVGFAVLLVAVESDEVAKRCSLTQFAVQHANGSSHCQDCPVCPGGKELSHSCGEAIVAGDVKNVHCLDCVQGKTYSSSNDTFQCYPCSETCPEQQVVLHNCSVTADKKCGDVKCGKGLYYETSTGKCEECSWCCENKFDDLVEKECIEGGMPKKQSCSVHHKLSCQPTTVKPTEGGKTTTPWATTTTTEPPSQSTAATPTQLVPTAMATSSSTTGKSAEAKQSKTTVAVKAVLISLTVGAVVAAVVVVIYKRCGCRSRGVPIGDPLSRTELGAQVGFNSTSKKSDSLKVLIPMTDLQDKRPLMEASANAGQHSIDEGMTLKEFSNKHYLAFEHVCELLDIRIQGCGNYEQVAKHYNVEDCTIQSRFVKHEGGPSKALFEWLGSTFPQLTLGEFFPVLKKMKRNDVVAGFQCVQS